MSTAGIKAEWEGLAGLGQVVRALGREIGNEEVLERALVKVGKPIRADIERSAPRSPNAPHVADTFVVRPSKKARAGGRAVVRVGPIPKSVGFIAYFLEFGRSGMAAQPFIRPTWDSHKRGFGHAMAVEIRKQFARVIRKYSARAK